MYNLKGHGKDKAIGAVSFIEAEPPAHLRRIVHRFLELKTTGTLAEDYRFHALPDGCTYVVFDQLDRRISGVSQLQAMSEEFNLGRSFHFVNVRFLPGVWQAVQEPVAFGVIDAPYVGSLPLESINERLADKDFAAQQFVLTAFVEDLIAKGIVAVNPVTELIFQHLDDIHNVADMAAIAKLSARQLQRRLKQTTGFAPHDFLKVLRLQQSLNGQDVWSYADQSHFIHSFRKVTGYTPGRHARKFDV